MGVKQERINRIKKLMSEAAARRDFYRVDQFKHLLKRAKKMVY